MISFTYQYKLKIKPNHAHQIDEWLEICRSVYNYAHRERLDYLESRKSNIDRCSLIKEYIIPANTKYPSYYNQSANLTQAKKIYPHLKKVHSQVLQDALKRLDTAWTKFFDKETGKPRFKGKGRFRSLLFPQIKESIFDGNQVKIPKIGWVKFRKSRDFPTGFTPKQLRVIKKADGYYIQIIFVCNEQIPNILPGKKNLGIDAGISAFVATSDKYLINVPQFVLNTSRKLKRLQRRFKKKIKGSKNWLKLKSKIAKLHQEITNKRNDWLFKLAHSLCDSTDNIFVEDINFTSWQKGLFGKQINNSAIGKFINQILPMVCFKRGKLYLKVDKNYTSQICPNCGYYCSKKTLNQRMHKCNNCGYFENRDIAAAIIIKQRGIKAVGQPV